METIMSTVSSLGSLRDPTSKPRLPKKSASSSTKDTTRVLRLAQERARDQRAEKRAAKKEEKRLAAEKLKTEVPFHVGCTSILQLTLTSTRIKGQRSLQAEAIRGSCRCV